MSQAEMLALLSTFGPLSAAEIAKTGMVNKQTASSSMNRLVKHKEAWEMHGRRLGIGGRLCIYGVL